ncbi:MAG TPA: hypothetical protein VLA78_07990, partial [Paracoccaceae bacterium]|nr:hypothetical protein [Paracoccaceae bacterium]
AEKVRRRLQHFIDRKVAALFEPLSALQKDESLTGLARGFAFRLVESLGVIPRDQVAEDAKALDQEARSALRKHGVRFGQFTIFIPTLLKPKPTGLRLVLHSLWHGAEVMPESPPPGLVTIPYLPAVPKAEYTLAGFHPAGTRAIRIDMLERLADLLRAKDSRAGFEATPEMLSITGMTLDQFADLMTGLGYRAERGERPKARPEATAPVAAAEAPAAETPADAAPAPDATETAEPVPETAAEPAAPESAPEPAPVEMEAFITFTWAPRPRGGENRGPRGGRGADKAPRADAPQGDRPKGDRPQGDRPPRGDRPQGDRPRGDRPRGDRPRGDRKPAEGTPAVAAEGAAPTPRPEGKPQHRRDGDRPFKGGGKGPKGGKDDRPQQPRSFEARPPRAEKPIDPDNPFAVLAALKTRT